MPIIKREWYDLENGQLILHAQAADPKTQLCDISNLLLQKWPAPEFSITTCLHLEEMKDGDVAGTGIAGRLLYSTCSAENTRQNEPAAAHRQLDEGR